MSRILSTLLGCATAVMALLPNAPSRSSEDLAGFYNARLVDSSKLSAVESSIVVRDGRIESVTAGPGIPANARAINLAGQFVVPGLIVAHAHVSDVNGIKPRVYTDQNTRRQLGVYARYGITSVFSLGGEQAPAFALRDAQNVAGLDRARIFMAGDVITGRTPDEARAAVARVAALKPDIIKVRVDDNLGTVAKMTPDVYRAVIDEAHKRELRVAAHIFYLDDARDLLKAGVDMIAHSVRDKELDDETIALLKARNVPYCPTLTREISTFVYESRPDFFNDPFFLREADRDVMAQLQEPARQKAMASSASAQRYKAALQMAMKNLKKASDAGVLIVMGTDSGAAPERFQGFFEHLEMEMMARAGMTPAQILRSATVGAAQAIGRQDVGAIEAGRWADFVVLRENPLTDIKNARSISAVWIAGRELKR